MDKDLLDDIQQAKDVLTAANDPVNGAILVKEVDPADVTGLAASVKSTEEQLVPAVINAKKAALLPTQLEAALRDQLVAKLRWIQGQAERTFPNDKAKRATYLIGKPNFGRNREGLDADARAILALAKTDTLMGVDAATDLPPIQKLLDDWVAADKEQKTRQTAAGQAVQALRNAVATINAGRRDIQKGADNTFAYTDPANAPKRRAFKLSADRPMKM